MDKTNSPYTVLKRILVALSPDNGMITVQRPYVAWVGDMTAACILSRLIWEIDRSGDDNYFDATQDYWQTYLLISDDVRRRAITRLKNMNIGISCRKLQVGGLRYRIDWEVFIPALLCFITEDKSGWFSGMQNSVLQEWVPALRRNDLYNIDLDTNAGSDETGVESETPPKTKPISPAVLVIAKYCFNYHHANQVSPKLQARINKTIFPEITARLNGQPRATADELDRAARIWKNDNPGLSMPRDGIKLAAEICPIIERLRAQAQAASTFTPTEHPTEPERPEIRVNADGTPKDD